MPVTEIEVRKGLAGVSSSANGARALRLFAVLPAIIALDQRRRHGLGAVPPRDDLGFAANFLHMTFGQVPEPAIVSAFETSLILYAEDGFSASTFAARIVTSTLSDLCSAVTAAISALKGPCSTPRACFLTLTTPPGPPAT
jgi:citrate synthase